MIKLTNMTQKFVVVVVVEGKVENLCVLKLAILV
jgi:hypothetical protein